MCACQYISGRGNGVWFAGLVLSRNSSGHVRTIFFLSVVPVDCGVAEEREEPNCDSLLPFSPV